MTSGILLALSLLFSVSLCSSAAIVFDILTNAPSNVNPFLAAFWRLFLQTIVQCPFFLRSYIASKRLDLETEILEYHSHSGLNLEHQPESKEEIVQKRELLLPKYYRTLPLCMVSGFFLGVHFSMWVYSLRYTSISHSLLWVSMGPIVLNGANWILFAVSPLLLRTDSIQRPSTKETFGAILGISGAFIMLFDVTKNDSDSNRLIHCPTIYGDLLAFSGAVAVSAYLVIGSKLRAFLPLWLYVFPVIGFASLTCLAFALFDKQDDITLFGVSNCSIFGFVSKQFLPSVLYLALGPGIGGHTMLNGLLKYVSPLVVSTAMLGEPIIGSWMGYVLGVQHVPGKSTFLGGSILLWGLFLVVRGSNSKPEEVNDDITGLNDEQCEKLDNRNHFAQYGSV